MLPEQFTVNGFITKSRKDYSHDHLLEKDCERDPFLQFEQWLMEALQEDPDYANAMTLSTVDECMMPDARIVLLKNISYGGFTFYTDYKSAKARQIDHNSKASLLFFWKELERQIRIQGEIRYLPFGDSDTYFNSRPFESQVAASCSQQSSVIADRSELESCFSKELEKYRSQTVPRPAHWGGYVLIPQSFEFWQGRKDRLHDRIRYSPVYSNKHWKIERLMP